MNQDKDETVIVEEEGKDGGGGGGGASETVTNSGSNKPPTQSDDDDDDDDEDEPVYIESSPCSRWQKRRETVSQRDIPGIDASYLAMDTEEGVEVVWNEVLFSEKKISEIQHNKVSEVFNKLIDLNHMNIVKFHDYWQDLTKKDDRPRVVFITEYMSSGSLKTFLRKTKKTKQNLSKNSWRRWCIQLLSALNYLHSCDEPIIHGNLTCDTIFIQNTGLLKIGSLAPDVLHRHIKSISDSSTKHLHFQAPELDGELNQITTAVDIYSLGMVTLEMINLDLGGNGDTHAITEDVVNDAISNLENLVQKDLIMKCLENDPGKRPTARELLFHPALFEIPSLKLLSVHSLADDIRSKPDRSFVSPYHQPIVNDEVFAELEPNREGVKTVVLTYKDCPSFDLDKLLEDVQSGLHPITAYHLLFPTQSSLSLISKLSNNEKHVSTPSTQISVDTDLTNSVQSITDSFVSYPTNVNDSNMSSLTNGMKSRTNTVAFERSSSGNNDSEYNNNNTNNNESTSINATNNSSTTLLLLSSSSSNSDEKEIRRIMDIQCKLKTKETRSSSLFISVKFQDRLQRDMTTEIDSEESSYTIAKELLELGLIHEADYVRVEQSINRALNATLSPQDIITNNPTASLIDIKKTAQTLQNQFNGSTMPNGAYIDGNNTSTWTNTISQPVTFLPT